MKRFVRPPRFNPSPPNTTAKLPEGRAGSGQGKCKQRGASKAPNAREASAASKTKLGDHLVGEDIPRAKDFHLAHGKKGLNSSKHSGLVNHNTVTDSRGDIANKRRRRGRAQEQEERQVPMQPEAAKGESNSPSMVFPRNPTLDQLRVIFQEICHNPKQAQRALAVCARMLNDGPEFDRFKKAIADCLDNPTDQCALREFEEAVAAVENFQAHGGT